MVETKKKITTFIALSHNEKLHKVREILEILSKKSLFFADLKNHFKQQKDIQENALDAMYGMIMNLAQQQKTISTNNK
jgi:hypothetical protein